MPSLDQVVQEYARPGFAEGRATGSSVQVVRGADERGHARFRRNWTRPVFRWQWAGKMIRRIFRLRRMWWCLGEHLKTLTEIKVVPVAKRQARPVAPTVRP